MSVISTAILAFSMSADAFAASLAQGAKYKNPRLNNAIRTGLLFGIIEGITPVIGWFIGVAASSFVASVDHWIAFSILVLLGSKMLYDSASSTPENEHTHRVKNSIFRLALIALATSIDALAVGVTLGFLGANILTCSVAIGTATFIMVTVGIMIGHYAGQKLGRVAEALGGIILIIVGCSIVYEHLYVIG